MLKLIIVAIIAAIGMAAFSASASASFYRIDQDEPSALAYCNFYKTRAMWAGQKARATPKIRKHRRRAISMWRKYNHCLKDNGWPVLYRIPTYR